MSTSSTAARNARIASFESLILAGSGTYPTMKIQTSGDVDLVSINLDQTDPVGTPSVGVASLNPPDGEGTWTGYEIAPVASGTATKVVFCDTDGNVIETATIGVGGSGAENIINSLTITTGVNVVFTGAPTITAVETT